MVGYGPTALAVSTLRQVHRLHKAPCVFAWTGIHFLTGQQTTPLASAVDSAITSIHHPVPCLAYGGPVRINCNFIRNRLWFAVIGVQINKRPDIPCFAKIVCWIVVICGIKAQILDGNIRIQVTKFLKRNNPADTVMVSCIQKTDM